MGLLSGLRRAFATLIGRAGEPVAPVARVELPTRITPLRPPKPPRKRYRVGPWRWEPFPPASLRIAASRLGRIVEFDGLDARGRKKWRVT